MRQHLEQRLAELKVEFEAGQRMLAEVDSKQLKARETMLRISGAIQVLEELLEDNKLKGGNGSGVFSPEQAVSGAR